MHQRNSSSSVSVAPSSRVAVTLRSSSVSVARHRVDRHVGQGAVAHEDALDLEAGDVLAAAAEVVGLAVDEEQEAVVVDPADVAGVVPPVPADARRSPPDGPSSPRTSRGGASAAPRSRPRRPEAASLSSSSKIRTSKYSSLITPAALGLLRDPRRLPRDQRRLRHPVGAAERLDPEAGPDHVVDLDRQRARRRSAGATCSPSGAPDRGISGRSTSWASR